MTARNLVFVHGGVSGVDRQRQSLAHSLHDALDADGALDAVEAAVVALEDDPALNAGFGSVLNRAGELELDAGIADGASRGWAGVANVMVRHPVSLARRVLEATPHVLLTGVGAMEFAGEMERLTATTPAQRRRWESAGEGGELDLESFGRHEHVDTVGAVAMSAAGALAAASSTGGVFGKMRGRVGDSPIFGAGIFASPVAAVVGTGVGELFLSTLACLQVGRQVEEGATPQKACEATIEGLGKTDPVAAGLLAVDSEGRVGAAFRGGSWAVEGPDGPLDTVRLP
jgi:beta-aspartyl-peptidase (threonine type)